MSQVSLSTTTHLGPMHDERAHAFCPSSAANRPTDLAISIFYESLLTVKRWVSGVGSSSTTGTNCKLPFQRVEPPLLLVKYSEFDDRKLHYRLSPPRPQTRRRGLGVI